MNGLLTTFLSWDLIWMFDRSNKEEEWLLNWPKTVAWSTSREGTTMTKRQALSHQTTLYANYCHDSYRWLNCLGFQALIRPCPHPQLQNPVYMLAGDRQRAKKKLISLVDGQWAWIPSAGAWRATYNLSVNAASTSECTWERRLSLPAIAVLNDARPIY